MSTWHDDQASYFAVMVPPTGTLPILADVSHQELSQAQRENKITGYRFSNWPQLLPHPLRAYAPAGRELNHRAAGLAHAKSVRLDYAYGPQIFLLRDTTQTVSPFRSNTAESWGQPLPAVLQDCLDNGWTTTICADFQEFITSPAWLKESD